MIHFFTYLENLLNDNCFSKKNENTVSSIENLNKREDNNMTENIIAVVS